MTWQPYYGVSILILLDYLFLYLYQGKIKDKSIKRFNPYFIGLPILITQKELATQHNYNVSILILLDYLFL